ncbi:tyrosine-type recombinase/integrase [Hugenholtzia roseola]|uniref:tyrosine-type recombinase/integrase n=1 Tax=Hugenholtzia roseola TaxID=1002 RepID=UPI000409256F|nr:site-specific integrase [Hugenholtzia roseola]
MASPSAATDFFLFFEELMDKNPHFPNRSSTYYQLQKYMQGAKKVPFKTINTKWVLGFQKHLSQYVSPNTAYNYFKVLKSALDEAQKEGHISSNPCREIPKEAQLQTVEAPLPDFLTAAELEILGSTEINFEKDIRHIFLYACYTGANWRDAFSLTWDKLIKKKGEYYLPVEGFESEPYLLPFPVQMFLRNKAELGEEKPQSKVFHFQKEAQISERSIERRVLRKLKVWCHLSNIDKNLHFLSASYTFLQWAHEKGYAPPYYLAILGRKNGQIGINFIEKVLQLKPNH